MKQNRFTKLLAAEPLAHRAGTAFAQASLPPRPRPRRRLDRSLVKHDHIDNGRHGNDHGLHAGLGLHHVPHRDERGAGEVLLHQEDDGGGSEGRTVEWSMLRPDMPVTYTYTKEGDRMVITKVTLTEAGFLLQKGNDHDDDDSP